MSRLSDINKLLNEYAKILAIINVNAKSEKLEKIKNILKKFSEISERSKNEIHNKTIPSLRELINQFSPILSEIKLERKTTTPNYNLFKILNIEYLETVVHTPFLRDLLDIDGLHSQGSLFFDAFLYLILPESSFIFRNYQTEYLEIIEEHNISDGRIDILVIHRHPLNERKFCIIIENKINASDQKDQLMRYYKYAKENLGLNDSQILLVYLAPVKSLPSEWSISKELRDNLMEFGTLKILGYLPHIRNWLLYCIEKISSQKLKQTLIQYIEILNEFSYEYK